MKGRKAMKNKTICVAILLAVVTVSGCGKMKKRTVKMQLSVSAPKADRSNVSVNTIIELPEQFADVPVEEISVSLKAQDKSSAAVPGQIVLNKQGQLELWWIVSSQKAGAKSSWVATITKRKKSEYKVFSWQDNDGNYLDLLFNGRKVTRYMYAFDNSSEQRAFETYRPFHHVFDANGEKLLTNGPDGENPFLEDKILYPHHRGIMVGWNEVKFEDKVYGFWGMQKGVTQKHVKFLSMTAGPVLARSVSLVHWNDSNDNTIVAEERQVTAFRQVPPAITLMEFQIRLKTVAGDIFLDGNAEHGGLQFRAHDDISKGPKELKATYLFHKDGIDPTKDYDLPWTAMSYGLNAKRYNVQHIDHPDNPRPSIHSAYRDYGRFGPFFKQNIKADQTLTLRYRICIGQGEMPERKELDRKYNSFVNAPKVTVIEPGN